MSENRYSIHSFSCCFAKTDLPENGISYDWIFENISDFVENVMALNDGGHFSENKWDVIKQFSENEFYPFAIIEDIIADDYDGGHDVECTAIEFFMIAENDDTEHPILLSDLIQPEKWYSAGVYYGFGS